MPTLLAPTMLIPPAPPIPPMLNPPVAPTMDVLWGESDLDRVGGRGRVSE